MGKNTSILLNKRSKDLKDVSNQTFAKKKKKKITQTVETVTADHIAANGI